ncbi:MAG: polymerase subunit delta [Thermotogaceae bacterium]|nr:polymerase subunit delta [Thermotogaceae bacterium]
MSLFEKTIQENSLKISSALKSLPISVGLVCDDIYILEKSLKFFLKNRSDYLDQSDVVLVGNWYDTIGIDSVRNIENVIFIHPVKKEKYVIINGAEKLTVESLNALLKIVEEPPEFAGIIFTMRNWFSLLPTIRSRLLKIELKVPDISEISNELEKLNFSNEEIWKVLFISRIDLSIFEIPNLKDLLNDEQFELTKKIGNENTEVKLKTLLYFKKLFLRLVKGEISEKEVLEIYEKLSEEFSGKDGFVLFNNFLRVFLVCLRDLSLINEGVNPNLIYNRDSFGYMLSLEPDSEKLLNIASEIDSYLKLSYGLVDTRLLLLRILLETYLLNKRGD